MINLNNKQEYNNVKEEALKDFGVVRTEDFSERRVR